MPLTEVKVYDDTEFNKLLESKKLEYIKNCSLLPTSEIMIKLELKANKDGPEAIRQFLDYRNKITVCSTASFLSSAVYL